MIKTKKINDSLKNSLLLIIIDFENLNLKEKNISDLKPLYQIDTSIDIQFVFLYPKTVNKQLIKKFRLIGNNIENYIASFERWIYNIYEIINKINCKYVIITDKILKIEKKDIFRIYNLIKGNTQNIFESNINDGQYKIYIIRSKILRDILDYKTNFKNINELINYVYSYPLPKLNYIPISFSSDNNYVSLCYTSMLSVLESKAILSFIIFYIIIPKNFENQNTKFLESLYEQYEYFNITFLQMDNRWDNAFISRYLTIHTYFRYSLAELIPQENKIIYLDVDTICLTDLSNFYHLNFKGKIILGKIIYSTKINGETYNTINAGILLLNLKEMRKIKFEKQLLTIMKNGFGYKNVSNEKNYNKFTDLIMPGQSILNLYFYKYLGELPPKYNARNRLNLNSISTIYQDLGGLYDKEYIYFSIKYPAIKHYYGEKKNLFFNEDWIYFAKKSKYFKEIYELYSNKTNVLDNFNYSCFYI